MEKQYKISESTMQSLANYLAKKPFFEVNNLIASLQNLELIEEKKEGKV